MSGFEALLRSARDGDKPSPDEAMTLAGCDDLEAMMTLPADLRDRGHGSTISRIRARFSYHSPSFVETPVITARSRTHPDETNTAISLPDEVLAIAQAGAAAGCREALFTLGDKPEARYRAARNELAKPRLTIRPSHISSRWQRLVLEKSPLLPHINLGGIATSEEIAEMRRVSVSQGLMLETSAERLSQKGGPHFGSPDKWPEVRLAMLPACRRACGSVYLRHLDRNWRDACRAHSQSLLQLRDVHDRYGNLQEVIVQNFRAKPKTRMGNFTQNQTSAITFGLSLRPESFLALT